MRKILSFFAMAAVVLSMASCGDGNTPEQPTPSKVELKGVFSISAGRQVRFSQGNLQYKKTATSGQLLFAEHQYDVLSQEENEQIGSEAYTIDLFGWGTGDEPAKDSRVGADYAAFKDWGDNIIGDSEAKYWRTLSKEEWNYLLLERPYASYLAVWATLEFNNVQGIILLPDNWGKVKPSDITLSTDRSWSANILSQTQWDALEQAGAVFLPYSRLYRSGQTVKKDNPAGSYWTSSKYAESSAYRVMINDKLATEYVGRYLGFYVRLVHDMPKVYTVYDKTTHVMTYYCDTQMESRKGNNFIVEEYSPNLDPSYTRFEAYTYYREVEKAVVDVSMKDYPYTSMYNLFGICFDFVTHMPVGLEKMTTIEGLENLPTARVTYMHGMFNSCSSLKSLDLRSFDTKNVTGMGQMFYLCEALTSLDLRSFNTANVDYMNTMFYGCSSLTSLNVSSFNTANVTDMGAMFSYCSSLTSLNLRSFNTTNVTNMGSMFYVCTSLTSLDVSSFDTKNVTDMGLMFYGCSSLTSLDLRSFNTANVKKMSYMFKDCTSLTSLDLRSFNTANVTDMNYMFRGCTSLTSLNLRSFNTANVTNMSDMFADCTSMTSLDVSSFDIKNVTDMSDMFHGCTSLTTIYCNDYWSQSASNIDYSYWMFDGCTSLKGGQGTEYDSNHSDISYAHPDGGVSNPGYFTRK